MELINSQNRLINHSLEWHGQLGGGHTVAFCYGAPGTTKTFMDPNFGQYTVARAYNWMAQIIGHLTTIYPNFNQWVLVSTV